MGKISRIVYVFMLISLQQISFLHARDLKNLSLNGKWELYYGLYDKSAPVTPVELKDRNWPVIPAAFLLLAAAGVLVGRLVARFPLISGRSG